MPYRGLAATPLVLDNARRNGAYAEGSTVTVQPTRARDDVAVVAPDGITVHPIALPNLDEFSLAEGRIPPGAYGVHAHRSLEQVTYVLAGRLTVTMGDPATGEFTRLDCGPGDTIGTPPLTTLSFTNPGPDLARVLFICAPPYSPDDADTQPLDRHRPLTRAELLAAWERQRQTRATYDARHASRLAAIAALLDQATP